LLNGSSAADAVQTQPADLYDPVPLLPPVPRASHLR